jgi:EAL domain-containing protein (putative c-di-GMP-specific phosphodiesterase class I)
MTNSVCLINQSTRDNCPIGKALNEAGYRVHRITLDETGKVSSLDPNPDILLLRVTGELAVSDSFWSILSNLQSSSTIPVLLVISGAGEDIFSRLLASKVKHYLFLPVGKKYLYQRIKDIIDGRLRNYAGEGVSLDLEYNRKRFRGTLDADSASGMLYSLVGNTLHHRHLLGQARRPKKKRAEESTERFEERQFEEEMWKALEEKQFQLYYQPVYDLRFGRLSGFEALIRWIHPEKGLIPPDAFIPVAEKTPFIMALGFWIIEEASEHIREWNRHFKPDFPLYVNVNLSARQFVHPELAEKILEIINEKGIEREMINFEITEGAFMDDMEQANLTLLKMKNEGLRIYMDDFGTGYSSLTYLLHFPVDCIKIDKSFVQWMHIEEASEQIVKSIIYLAHNLDMIVVSEGVESEEHLTMLRTMECDYSQGYYHSKPMPREKAEQFIAENL